MIRTFDMCYLLSEAVSATAGSVNPALQVRTGHGTPSDVLPATSRFRQAEF